MYAERYAGHNGFKPGSMGAALAINGAVIAALVFSAPVIETVTRYKPFVLYPVANPPPPKPIPTPRPDLKATPQPAPRPKPIDPIIKTTTRDDVLKFDPKPTPFPGPIEGTDGAGSVPLDPLPPPPLIGAEADPRYAGDFQPAYPPSERRAGKEGRVTVRVLIGVDGRVKRVERASAASDAFFEATRRRALSSWRFKPATRGGIPEESWRTMSVSFVLQE